MYFLPMVDIYTRADAQPGDYDTTFGLSGIPYYTIHLALQRAHDDEIAPTCGATVMPPALRPYLHEDILSQYEKMSHDPRFAHLDFPALEFGRQIPENLVSIVREHLLAEHAAFINHL